MRDQEDREVPYIERLADVGTNHFKYIFKEDPHHSFCGHFIGS